MSNENTQYTYEEDFYKETTTEESYSAPVMMGKERDYFARRNRAVKEFVEFQTNADLQAEYKKKVDTRPQLFGISNQNINKRVSLDEKYPADLLFQIKTDNLLPYFPQNTVVGLKFDKQHASGEICVYRYRGQVYCNVIKFENGKVIAHSPNPKYKDVFLNPDEYYFIAAINHLHVDVRDVKW